MAKIATLVFFGMLLVLHFAAFPPSLTLASAKLVLAIGLGFALYRLVYDQLGECFDAPRITTN